jgi:hypothetical protein
MQLVIAETPKGSRQAAEELQKTLCRMFAFLEANAGSHWEVPSLAEAVGLKPPPKQEASPARDEDPLLEEDLDELDDDDDLFSAAYDSMIFRDSADDGHFSDTVDEGGHKDDASFEVLAKFLEPRLQFLDTVAELWQMAAAGMAPHLASLQHGLAEQQAYSETEFQTRAREWLHHAQAWQTGLRHLRKTLWERQITLPSGDHDSNVEYDEQLQTKFYLLHIAISTDIQCETAERALQSCVATPIKYMSPGYSPAQVQARQAIGSRSDFNRTFAMNSPRAP